MSSTDRPPDPPDGAAAITLRFLSEISNLGFTTSHPEISSLLAGEQSSHPPQSIPVQPLNICTATNPSDRSSGDRSGLDLPPPFASSPAIPVSDGVAVGRSVIVSSSRSHPTFQNSDQRQVAGKSTRQLPASFRPNQFENRQVVAGDLVPDGGASSQFTGVRGAAVTAQPASGVDRTFAEAVRGVSQQVLSNEGKAGDGGGDWNGAQQRRHDGKPVVSFEQSEWNTLASKDEGLTLVGAFENRRPTVDRIRIQFQKLFPLVGSAHVGVLNAKHVLIRFTLREDCDKILAANHASVDSSVVTFIRWSPNWNDRRDLPMAKVWVLLPSLPYHLFDSQILRRVCAPIGNLVAVDMPTARRTRPSVARAKVEISLLRPLVDRIWIQIEGGDGFWQRVEYESVPLFCTTCSRKGHTNAGCKKRDADKQVEAEQEEGRDVVAGEGGKLPMDGTELEEAVELPPGGTEMEEEEDHGSALEVQSDALVEVAVRTAPIMEMELQGDGGSEAMQARGVGRKGRKANKEKKKAYSDLSVRTRAKQRKSWSDKNKSRQRLKKACESEGVGQQPVAPPVVTQSSTQDASASPEGPTLNPNAVAFVPGARNTRAAAAPVAQPSRPRLQRSPSEGHMRRRVQRAGDVDVGFHTDAEDTSEGEDPDFVGSELDSYFGRKPKGHRRSFRDV